MSDHRAHRGIEWHICTPDEVSAINAPKCRARRPYTSARCETPAHVCMFEPEHVGRDRVGRWHVWPHPMVTGTFGARLRALIDGEAGDE